MGGRGATTAAPSLAFSLVLDDADAAFAGDEGLGCAEGAAAESSGIGDGGMMEGLVCMVGEGWRLERWVKFEI